MTRTNGEWAHVGPGLYRSHTFGSVTKEGRYWTAKPIGGITRYPYRSARSAMVACERESATVTKPTATVLLAEAYNGCSYGYQLNVDADWMNSTATLLERTMSAGRQPANCAPNA